MMHFIHTQQRRDYMHVLVTSTATSATRSGLRSASSLSYRNPCKSTTTYSIGLEFRLESSMGNCRMPFEKSKIAKSVRTFELNDFAQSLTTDTSCVSHEKPQQKPCWRGVCLIFFKKMAHTRMDDVLEYLAAH